MIYRSRHETLNLDHAKTPGFDDRNSVHISNIDRVTIVESREFSRRPKSMFHADCGIHWFLFLLLTASCFRAEKSAVTTLRICFNTQPATLDPCKAGDFTSSTLICMVYEGLTRCLPGGEVEPALAKTVEISESKTVYTFHLRKSCWSDGTPITAHDFETSWKRILSSPSICSYLFYPIKNAERSVKGEVPVTEVGISALDEYTLRVELEHPTPYFYSLTAFPSFLAAPPKEGIWSGPFQIEKMAPQNEIILVKNPTFWNRDQIFLDQIQISIIPDEMTALQMFERGDLDWLGGPLSPLPPDALEKLKGQIQFIPSSATTLCTFNTGKFPFHNCHLRQAFSYAIDREEIAKPMGQVPATSMLPPSLSKQVREMSSSEKARSHFEKGLEELEVKKIEGLILYYRPGQVEKRLAQTLQKQWKEVLGVEVELVPLDFKTHASRLQNRDYQMALSGWIAQFDDPVSILERFKSKNQLKNYPDWEDGQYTKLLDEANCSKQREIVLQELEEIFADQMPLTPIYHGRSASLCGPRIKQTPTTPSGGVLFERFCLNE